MRNFVFLLMMLAGTCCAMPVNVPESSETDQSTKPVVSPVESDPIQFALSMGIGWNLGNQMDAHLNGEANETCWGNKEATEYTFKALKKAGFRTVRIPVTWMGHIGGAPAYTLEKNWLNRVAELVEMAKKNDLRVIINIHHDGMGAADTPSKGAHWLDLPAAVASEEKNQEIKQKLTMVWLQIGQRFQNEGEYLIFETLNEIQDGNWGNLEKMDRPADQFRVLNEWNQVCVNAIRAAGGQNETRFIGVPGYVANPDLTVNNLVLPEDVVEGRIMVAVHSYDPWDYAGSAKYQEWGHTGKDVVPGADENTYVAMLNRLYNMYVRRGVPVYFGEFGSVHRSNKEDEAFRLYYFRYVCKAMRERKMAAVYWDNGNAGAGEECFGIMNHATGRFLNNGEEVARAMIDSWENKDGLTLKQVYDTAPESSRK